MKKLIATVAIALATFCTPLCLHAQIVTAPPPQFDATYPLPEVHCLVVTDGDGYAQVDCFGPVMREPVEAYVPVGHVNQVLAIVADEWTYDVKWEVR